MAVGASAGNGVFNQRFFYVVEGGKKEDEMEAITVTFDAAGATAAVSFPESALSNSTTPSSNNNTTATETKTGTSGEASFEQKLDDHNKKHGGENVNQNSTPTISNVAGLIYRIQLGALASDPGKAKFKTLGKVDISNEGGFYKVLYGSYSNKEDAIKNQADAKVKGFDGFVVKYQDGVRVK